MHYAVSDEERVEWQAGSDLWRYIRQFTSEEKAANGVEGM